jgi:hypothetical protein
MLRKQTYPLLWSQLQVYRLRIFYEVAPKPIRAPVICKCNHLFNFNLLAKVRKYF